MIPSPTSGKYTGHNMYNVLSYSQESDTDEASPSESDSSDQESAVDGVSSSESDFLAQESDANGVSPSESDSSDQESDADGVSPSESRSFTQEDTLGEWSMRGPLSFDQVSVFGPSNEIDFLSLMPANVAVASSSGSSNISRSEPTSQSIDRSNVDEKDEFSFDFSNAEQSDELGYYLKAKMYEKTEELAKHPVLGRIIPLPLLLAEVALMIVFNVVLQVVEPIFKGLANLFLFPFSENLHFTNGLHMLLIRLPLELIQSTLLIVGLAIIIPISILIIPLAGLIAPETMHEKAQNHAEQAVEYL